MYIDRAMMFMAWRIKYCLWRSEACQCSCTSQGPNTKKNNIVQAKKCSKNGVKYTLMTIQDIFHPLVPAARSLLDEGETSSTISSTATAMVPC